MHYMNDVRMTTLENSSKKGPFTNFQFSSYPFPIAHTGYPFPISTSVEKLINFQFSFQLFYPFQWLKSLHIELETYY